MPIHEHFDTYPEGYGNPMPAPCVVISAGKTTTKIIDNSNIKGYGGPGQELTVSFAIPAHKASGVCMLSIDSEGTDGTTQIAGGITDPKTYDIAVSVGGDLHEALRDHACDADFVRPLGTWKTLLLRMLPVCCQCQRAL